MELRALLEMPELGMTLLAGGKHLARRITWVVTTDLSDPQRYLSGGELVLTGMLWRHDGTDAEQFVASLTAAGVAGLGAGDPDLDAIPDDLIAACRRHDLPLFGVSSSVGFSTITERVMQRLSAGRSGGLATLLERHRHLIDSGTGFTEVLDLVYKEVGLACQVISATGHLIRSAEAADRLPSADERERIAARLLRGGTLPRRIRPGGERGFSVFGTGATPHTGWFLVVDDDHAKWPPERRAVIDELLALIDLEFGRVLRRPQAEADLIAALESGSDPDALAAAFRQAGMNPHREFAVAVIAADATDATLAPAATAEVVAAGAEQCVWAAGEDEIVALATVDDSYDHLLAHARATAAALSSGLTEPRVSIGVSGPVTSLDGLVGALYEARHTQRIAATRPDGVAVAGPDDLTSHVLLLAAVPADTRTTFRDRVLGPVLEYDRLHDSDLLATLESFLDNSCSWSGCAADLHLHVNTLRYRIERIERLTGRDLRRLADRVDLFLAMRLR